MAEHNSTASSGLTRRLVKKALMPIVATAVTAAASYVGKKAPQLIENKVMPKLREATSQPAGDLAEGLAERAKAVVGHESKSEPAKRLSSAKRDAQRRQRAAHRKARRTGSGAKED